MSIFLVKQMHDKFKFSRLEKPGFLDDKLMKMRLDFLMEELQETASACGFYIEIDGKGKLAFFRQGNQVDLAAALDGLVDLEVVTLGTADLMGLASHVPPNVKSRYGTIWSEAFDRVHRANMSKERVPRGGAGKRGTDHDLIKPAGWKAPQFGDLLQ